MGDPVASGTPAESTSGSGVSIHREAASSDFSRFRRHILRSYDSHTLPTVADSAVVVRHNFPDRGSNEATLAIAGVARFVPSHSDVGVAAGGCFAARMAV